MKLSQSDHTIIVIIVKYFHHRLKGALESMSLHPHSTPHEVACFILSIEKTQIHENSTDQTVWKRLAEFIEHHKITGQTILPCFQSCQKVKKIFQKLTTKKRKHPKKKVTRLAWKRNYDELSTLIQI